LIKTAATCAQAGETDLEISLLELAVELRRQASILNSQSTADVLDRIAQLRHDMKDLARALQISQEALQIRQAVLGSHHRDLADNLYRLAEFACEAADYRAARGSLLRAVAIERAGSDHGGPRLADMLMLLTRTETALGDFAEAITHCEKAVQIEAADPDGRHSSLMRDLNTLASLYQWAGRPGDALATAQRAVAIGEAKLQMNDAGLVEPLCHLSEASLGCGRYRDACLAAERALAIGGSAAGPDQARALAVSGCVLLHVGEMHSARKLFSQALHLLRSAEGDPRDTAQVLVNLARVDACIGECDSARRHLEEALGLLRGKATGGWIAAVLQNLAAVTGMLGDRLRALALYREALQIERHRLGQLSEDVGLNLTAIGKLECGESQYSTGIASLVEGMAVLLNGDDPAYLAEGLRTFAQIFGRRQSAVWVFFEKLAVNLLQSVRGEIAAFNSGLERVFVLTHDEAYRALGDRLIADGRLPEAQQVIRMVKEQELFRFTRGAVQEHRTLASLTPTEDYWNGRITDIRNDIKASCVALAHSYQGQKIDGKRVRQAITSATADLSACLRALAADFARIEAEAEAKSEPKRDPAHEAIRPRPPAGVALIQYLLRPRGLRIVVTTSGSQRDHEISLVEDELNHLIFAVRSALQERSEAFMPAARRLHDILIAPLLPDLAGAQVLAFSLDGVLRYIPMAALHDGARYLIENFALLVNNDAVDSSTAAAPAYPPRGVGLGSSRAVEDRPPLPGVRDELEAVIRTADNGNGIIPGVIRLDEDFTAAALRQALSGGNTVVHIASHFVFAVAREAASYLQLGDGSRLTMTDIVDMRFDGIDLVVLSACDTALVGGYHQGGSEIESLGALVRRQGAHNVVATLWPAADMASATLMRAFYSNRYEGGLALPEALRRAQMGLLRGEIEPDPLPIPRGVIDPDEPDTRTSVDARHPFYWAPYVLMGDLLEAGPNDRRGIQEAGPSS
jgi:CHAT domain-containing protein/tetratricopeptide (TPR) repeat protein